MLTIFRSTFNLFFHEVLSLIRLFLALGMFFLLLYWAFYH